MTTEPAQHPATMSPAAAELEARYHTLFNSLDAGFCVIELAFDPQGQPVDYRFIEVNAAFATHTGLDNALDKWMHWRPSTSSTGSTSTAASH